MDFGSIKRRPAATTYAKRARAPLKKEPASKPPLDESSSEASDQDQGPTLPASRSQPAASASHEAPSTSVHQPRPQHSGSRTQPTSTFKRTADPRDNDGLSRVTPPVASPTKSATRPRRTSRSPQKPETTSSQNKASNRVPLPSRPAKNLGDIFDVLSPSLEASDSFSGANGDLSSSASGPSVPLSRDETESSAATKADSPLLQASSLPQLERPASPTLGALPAKRPKLFQRMAPRSFKRIPTTELKLTSDVIAAGRPLKRTETDPLAGRRLDLAGPADTPSQPDPLTPLLSHGIEVEASTSTRSLPGSPRRARQFSEAPEPDLASRQKTFAAIPAVPTASTKRTYVNHRSFLADRVEDSQLGHPGGHSGSAQSTDGQPALGSTAVENEIESQVRGAGPSQAPSTSASAAAAFGLQPTRESYADLLKKWSNYGDDDIEWDESQDPTLALKSITSLRSAGELRRFNDDLEYLFSGLSPAGSISIRRSSAIEFVRLLCGSPETSVVDVIYSDEPDDTAASTRSAEFLRKLRAVEGIVRVFDLLREASAGDAVDDVLDVALAMFLGKVMQKPATAEPLLRERRSEMLECLSSMLARASRNGDGRRDGLARLRLTETTAAKPLPAIERSVLRELRSTAILSNLVMAGSTHPSLRNLVLGTLCSTSSLHKKIGSEVLQDMVRTEPGMEEMPTLFSTILQTYVHEGRKGKQRLADFSKGLELLAYSPFDTWPDLDAVDLCVRFIDRCMEMIFVGLGSSVSFDPEVLESTVDLLRLSLELAPLGSTPPDSSESEIDHGQTAMDERSLQVLHAIIKLVLDLTQVDSEWAHGFASSHELVAALIRAMFLAESSAARNPPATTHPKTDRSSPPNSADRHLQKVSALLDDLLHLSLAAITNLLIKQGGAIRATLIKLRLNPYCRRKRSCAVACSCDDADRAVSLLLGLFFRTQQGATLNEDSDAAYLSNSLATAIAQFAVGGQTYLEATQSASNAEYVEVFGSVADGSGFTALVEAVEKFATDMQADAIETGSENDGQQRERKVAETDEMKGFGSGMATETGTLIKELAWELKAMARR